MNHGRNIDEDIAKSFKVFDIDGDGLITQDELQTTMDRGCSNITLSSFLSSLKPPVLVDKLACFLITVKVIFELSLVWVSQ